MAKPVELVTTLEGEDARRFLRMMAHPKRNRALERTIARSRRFDRLVERGFSVPRGKAVRRRRTGIR